MSARNNGNIKLVAGNSNRALAEATSAAPRARLTRVQTLSSSGVPAIRNCVTPGEDRPEASPPPFEELESWQPSSAARSSGTACT